MEYKNRAWIYCRIDAPKDTHGTLKNQRKQLMDYADQMGFETVGCSGGYRFRFGVRTSWFKTLSGCGRKR